jgi:hypothetical protein
MPPHDSWMANRIVMRLSRLVSEFDELNHSIGIWEIRLSKTTAYPKRFKDPIIEREQVFRFATREELVAYIETLRARQHEISLEMNEEVRELAINRR